MKRKGTPVNLYLCPELVGTARKLAERNNGSLSDMVERGLRRMIREQRRKERVAA